MAKRKVGASTKSAALNKPDTEKIEEPTIIKGDTAGFPGELEINIDQIQSDGRKLHHWLAEDVGKWLDAEVVNHQKFVDRLAKYDKQYCGKKSEAAIPYPGANNIAAPITRINTDGLAVRVFDVIWGQKKVYLCTGKKQPFIDLAPKIEDGIEWWQKDVVHLKKKMFSPIMQAIKTGTGFVLLDYVKKNRTCYRYASPDEIALKTPGIFKFKNGQNGIKKVITAYDGPDVIPISREDFIYSSDATNLQDALMCGYKFTLRKPELRAKVAQGYYGEAAYDRLTNPDKVDETKKKRAETKGLAIRDEGKDQYDFWRLWVRYDVDEDGEEDDIVITFHRESKTIMRAIYNPIFMGFRPIVPIVGLPREYSLEGEGAAEILESIQVAVDKILNSQLNTLDQITASMYIVKDGSGLEQSFKIAPGTVFVTSEEIDRVILPLHFPGIYPETYQQVAELINWGQQALGISPSVLGQSTAERPVARETFQVIQEANKKFKMLIDNIRDCVGEVGMMAVEMFAQYKPKYTYYTEGAEEGAGLQENALDFPYEYLREGLKIELAASSELMNTEIRREVNLTLFQLMKSYYTDLASMVQAILNPNIPPDFKKFLMESSKIGGNLLRRIVQDFDVREPDTMVLDIDKTIDVQRAMVPPPPPMMMGPGGGPPGQPGGPPPGPPMAAPRGEVPQAQGPTLRGPAMTPTGLPRMPGE